MVRYSIIVIKIIIVLVGEVTPVPEGLPFKLSGSYLNFSACFMKSSVLLRRKILKVQNKQYFIENKTDFAACLKNTENSIFT